MANHGGNFGINHFLGNNGTHFWIRLIVLGHHLQHQQFAVNFEFFGVGLRNRERHTVFIILTQMRDGSGQRAGMADFYIDGWFGRRGGLGLFFFTTANNPGCKHGGEYEFI